jgi:hypothetical protein
MRLRNPHGEIQTTKGTKVKLKNEERKMKREK